MLILRLRRIRWDSMAMGGKQKSIVCAEDPKRVEDRPNVLLLSEKKKWFSSVPDPCLWI